MADTFHPFPRLAPELKLKILYHAVPFFPRIIELYRTHSTPQHSGGVDAWHCRATGDISPLLLLNRESYSMLALLYPQLYKQPAESFEPIKFHWCRFLRHLHIRQLLSGHKRWTLFPFQILPFKIAINYQIDTLYINGNWYGEKLCKPVEKRETLFHSASSIWDMNQLLDSLDDGVRNELRTLACSNTVRRGLRVGGLAWLSIFIARQGQEEPWKLSSFKKLEEVISVKKDMRFLTFKSQGFTMIKEHEVWRALRGMNMLNGDVTKEIVSDAAQDMYDAGLPLPSISSCNGLI